MKRTALTRSSERWTDSLSKCTSGRIRCGVIRIHRRRSIARLNRSPNPTLCWCQLTLQESTAIMSTSTRRMARVASMIREVVSSAILFELRDPRVKNVTVLGADVSPDLRYASVRISVMGDEKMAALTIHGLDSARGFLQAKVAEFIKSKYTPQLRFVVDDGIRRSFETSSTLREVLPPDAEPSIECDDESTSADLNEERMNEERMNDDGAHPAGTEPQDSSIS